jgi:hypothetical protein
MEEKENIITGIHSLTFLKTNPGFLFLLKVQSCVFLQIFIIAPLPLPRDIQLYH